MINYIDSTLLDEVIVYIVLMYMLSMCN